MAQANEAYKVQQDEIKRQVAEISRLLKLHDTDTTLNNYQWSYIGDLVHVNEQLAEIVQFLK